LRTTDREGTWEGVNGETYACAYQTMALQLFGLVDLHYTRFDVVLILISYFTPQSQTLLLRDPVWVTPKAFKWHAALAGSSDDLRDASIINLARHFDVNNIVEYTGCK
jgi:hypothetical protein